MAIYHFQVRVITRRQGPTAFFAAAYRASTRLENPIDGRVADYSHRRKPLYAEILAPPGAPEWVRNRAHLWSQVEAVEHRKDAQLARELQIAVPAELTDNQQIQLIKEFIHEQFVAFGMVADITIHRPPKKGDSRNIHAHVLLTTRNIRSDGFCLKNRDWNSPTRLNEWRRQWAIYANRALEKAGCSERIDHRRLEVQEQDPRKAPYTRETKKAQPATTDRKRGKNTTQTQLDAVIAEVQQSRKEIEELKQQLAEFRSQLARLTF